MRTLSQKEIEKYYEKCYFDDECDSCENPEHGSYAKMYYEPEGVTECEYYICGKCASEAIPQQKSAEVREYESWGKFIEEQTKLGN